MSFFVAEFRTLHYEIVTGDFPQTNTLARLRGVGTYAPISTNQGNLQTAGAASLDLVFVGSAVDHCGRWTDLAEDGGHLELDIALPESYMAWASSLLQQVQEGEVVSLLFRKGEGASLENTILGHSSPRIVDVDG